jgi:hypothetical protein
MTLSEEFDKEFPIDDADYDLTSGLVGKEMKNWFKSYILSLMKSVKGDKAEKDQGRYEVSDIGNSYWTGYNQALSNQEARIAEELKKRGM